MKITFTKEFSDEEIGNLLCSAFEGGSNYWALIEKVHADEPFPKGYYMHDVPFMKGGYIDICDKHEPKNPKREKGRLNREAIEKGFQVMLEKAPRHLGNLLADHADAETGDVFLPCCLFGQIVFG